MNLGQHSNILRFMLTLSIIAKHTGSNLIGKKDKVIENISYKQPNSKSIIFISQRKNIPDDIDKYGAVLTSPDLKDEISNENILISKNPKLSFAKLTNLFVIKDKKRISKPKTNNNLRIGNNVRIGSGFLHGYNVVIEDNVSIGDNVSLGHNVCIHHDCILGNNIIIESGTQVGSEGFGNVPDVDGNWNHISHLGKVVIENDIRIGSNCCIDRGTINDTLIKNGVIIDNLVHIAHNVIIGEKTAIAAHVGIAGSTIIGNRNMIGGMVGIIDHINTVDDVIISATSTVQKDIREPGIYTGFLPIAKHTVWKRIAMWILKLDKIAKFVNLKKEFNHD